MSNIYFILLLQTLILNQLLLLFFLYNFRFFFITLLKKFLKFRVSIITPIFVYEMMAGVCLSFNFKLTFSFLFCFQHFFNLKSIQNCFIHFKFVIHCPFCFNIPWQFLNFQILYYLFAFLSF